MDGEVESSSSNVLVQKNSNEEMEHEEGESASLHEICISKSISTDECNDGLNDLEMAANEVVGNFSRPNDTDLMTDVEITPENVTDSIIYCAQDNSSEITSDNTPLSSELPLEAIHVTVTDEGDKSENREELCDRGNDNACASKDVDVEMITVSEDTATEECSADITETAPSYYYWNYKISSGCSSKLLITTCSEEIAKEKNTRKQATFFKGCKWAPDGSCLLSNSDDDVLRLFNFPSSFSSIQNWETDDFVPEKEDWLSTLKVKEGGQVYDFCWYPLMSSMDPVSSCFLSTSSEAPIHLWDAFTGKLRASYRAINHLEQLISAYSLTFDTRGETIYSGFDKHIRIFNITRPGQECTVRVLKHEISDLNQYGIVGSLAVNPSMQSIYAVGSFDKTVGLYCEDGSVICLLQGHYGGITHMKFSNDGLKLFTGARRDSRLICWDMRNMGTEYKIFDRQVDTHQRIYFDLTPNNDYLISGGTDGNIKVWDLVDEEKQPITFQGNSDCVNGVSLNPYVPLLATSSGQRHFLEIADDSDDELFVMSESAQKRSCDIKLWKIT